MPPSKLLIHRGNGFYLQATNGRSATWNKDPSKALQLPLLEAERLTNYLNATFNICCTGVDPIIAILTRTTPVQPPTTNPRDTAPIG